MAKQVTSIGLSVLFTLLLLVLAAVSGSPLRKKGCQGKKTGAIQTHYESGHTYVYNYEGHTVTSLPGQQGDGIKLNLKATAEISIGDNCLGVLKVDGLQVTGPDGQKYTNINELEGYEAEFDFENGVVGRDLLTADESEVPVNIKRAILSLFQVNVERTANSGRINVLDVFGLCPTDLSISTRGNTAYITKFRNLNNCQLREHLRQDFSSVTYQVESDLQTTPLLEATQEVKQQLKGGILSSAESHEKYLYKPFSNQDAGAKTLVETKLTLVSHSKKDAPKVSGNIVRSIVFDPPHVNIGASNAAAVVDALHKAHEAMPQYVGETAAKEFANVVNIVRQTSKNDLLSVYSQVKAGAGFKDKNAATKLFLDALFRAGTGDAVEVAVELLKSNKITGPVAELYYLQFAYTKHVTKSALAAAVSLLDLPNPSKLAYLGVGALGGRYCAQHTCDGVPEVDEFLEKLSHSLNSGCKVSSYDDEIKVVATLKALHNVHHLNDAVINKLKTCVLDDHVPTRVRAAVLDVFQSDACKVKETSLEVLKDIQLDSELRIKAFLALIECPCNKIANQLKQLLDAEPSYQVGSFIASYLRNLRASTNPGKAHQKAVYGEIRTTKRFPIDFRKFSNNFEYSELLGGLNIGTTAESNLIYSQKSFLPRVSTLNLTTEVFGHSINFLEVEFRQENLDLLAETLFGPKGYFNTHELSELVKSGKEKWTDLENTVKQRLNHAIRGKRSVTKEDLYGVQQKSTSPYSSEPDREILLELSTKLFGAEVGWLTWHQNARDASKNAFDNTFKVVDEVVKKLKDFDYKVRQHNTFLDTELVYPTALGLPLKLVLTGSSAVHIELEGKIDINQLLNDFKNFKTEFKFVPSAAVEIVGAFEVDAYAVEAGVKVAATLHTATGTDVTVKSTGGIGIDVTLGLPVQRQDVLTVKTEVLSTVQERGKPEVDKEISFPGTPKRSYHGCYDQFSKVVGLTFCGTVSFPWDPVASKAAFFPLNGPSKLSLVVEANDIKHYHFRASHNADTHKTSLELLFETSFTHGDHKIELLLERTYEPFYKGLKAEFRSPWIHTSGELAFTDSDKELSLLAKANYDDREYYVKLGASVTGDPNHATYHPLLEYKTPERLGNLVAQKGTKGRPEKLSQPFSVAGSVTVDKTPNSRKYTFNDVVFTSPQGEYKVEGSIASEGSNSFNTNLKIHYGKHHVILISDFKRSLPQSYYVRLNVQPSQYPDFGINLTWDYKRDKNNIQNFLSLVHGNAPENDEAKFILNQEAHYQFENLHSFDFSTKNKVTYPLLGIVGKFDASVAPKNLHFDVEVSYEKQKFQSELTAKTGIKRAGDYDVEFYAKVLENTLKLGSKREVVSPQQSKFTTELEVHPGGKYTVVADVTHIFERNDINFQLDAVVNIHGQANEYKLDSGLIYNQHLFDTHYKLKVGDVEYVDISANFKSGPGENPSGNAKVFLKNYLVGNAQYKYASGKGSATLNVDIPKLGQKLKGTGDLQVTGTHHVATVELYYNADKNPNQKIIFHTDTDFKKDALESKNELNILNSVTKVNVKGILTGKLEDGQLKGDFDILLPNDYKFAGKLDQTLHVRPTNSEGDVNVELTVTSPHNSGPSKITLEFAAKNVDTKQYSFDGQSKVAYYSPTGKDAAIIVAAKNIPQRELRVIEAQGVLQGSLIGETLRVELNTEVYETSLTYKGHGSYGTGTVVDFNGKVNRNLKEHDNHYIEQFSLDQTVEAKLPFVRVKHILYKISVKGEAEKERRLQFNYVEELTLDGKTYKYIIDSNTEVDKGSNKIVLIFPNSEPRTIVSTWYFSQEDYDKNDLVKGGFTLSGDQDSKLTVDINGKKDYSDLNLHATLHTSLEKFKNAELTLNNKYIAALELDTDFILVVDDNKITVVNKVTPGPFPGIPNIDFTATHPKGKTRVYFILQSKGSNDVSGKAELEWTTNGGGTLTASGKANYESFQNFRIEADVESPKLNLKKWHVVLANKPAKTSKTFVIQATEAGVQVINGRLEYHVEDKENSYKAGVSGTVKVKSQNQQLKADVFLIKFTPAEHGELGTESGISIHLGEKSFEVSNKYTNKETRGSVTLCYKANECSVSEVHSVFKVIEFGHLQHDFGATFDLRACGVNDGFIVIGKTVSEPKSFDHAVELKLLNAKHTTYKLHSYLNEQEVGVVLTLPQRVIATEGKLSHVKEKGEHTFDLNFWLDKERHPGDKAGLHVLVVVNPTNDGTELRGDAKFSHPALQKDISVTSKAVVLQHNTLFDGTIVFDIFAKSNQKITLEAKLVKNVDLPGYNVTGHIITKGTFIDVVIEGGAELTSEKASYNSKLTYQDEKHNTKNAEVSVLLTYDDQHVYVKLPTVELLKINYHFIYGKTILKGTSDIVIAGVEPIVFLDEWNLTHWKITLYFKNDPNGKLFIDFLFDISEGFSVHLTTIRDGNTKDVLHVGVDLTDQHFLKTHFTWSTQDIKSLLQLVVRNAETSLKRLDTASKEVAAEVKTEIQGFLNTLKNSQPNFQNVISSYETELKKLKVELENDEGFTEASENVKKIIQAVTKAVEELSKRVIELAGITVDLITKVGTAVQELSSKLLPKLVDLFTNLLTIFNQSVVRALIEFISVTQQVIIDFIKDHEDEIKKFVGVVTEFFEDVGKVVGTTIVQVRNEVVGFVKLLLDQVKALPAYATLKEQYDNFISQLSQYLVPENTWSVIKEVIGPFKDSLPTSELKEFVTAVEEYVDRHLHKQSINDAEELQALLSKAIKALKSLVTLITDHLPKGDSTKEVPSFLGLKFPVSVNALLEFPKVIALKSSPLQFLTTGNLQELPTLQEFLLTLRPSLNPLDWVPPYRAHGAVIQLQHFVTLDDRHFTFKGTCAYVLLQDIVDGNFSVALDFATKSLIITDHHDTVQIFQDSKIKLNDVASEFPIATGEFVAWKDFGSVNVKHKAGLFVKCDSHYSYCFFYVNGYYFGKTQGLLGVLDYEPFDDFRQPNGKVVTKVNDFGNSWKVDPSCGDVSGATHHDHAMPEPAECANLFGGSSPLKLGYLVSPVAPYREACSHIVADAPTADAKKQAACAIAAAYVTSTRSQYFPISLPAECVHCSVVGGNPIQAQDSVSVRVPQKTADVVIVVEQVTTNSELFKDLITPLVTTLTTELKSKGITDVHFTLIGYGEATHNYPAVYTSSGKLSFEGKTKNIQFRDYVDPFNLKLEENCDNRFKYLKAVIESELGLGAPSRAYQFAATYPFKIATSKVLVGVVGNTNTTPFALSLQHLGALYSTKVLRDRGVSFHLVAPVEDLQLENSDAKTLKSVVGFDSDRVFVLSDSKRKDGGNVELRKHLTFKNNIWIPIALESYGTTYVAQNFIDAKPSARKQFLQVFSHRIVESLLTPLHEDCTCKIVNGIHPFAECKVTSRVEREHLASFTKGVKGGVKG